MKHRGKPPHFKYLFSSISKERVPEPLSSGLITPYSLLPTPYSLLPTPYSLFPPRRGLVRS
ncbi:MAG TPA: hypothetical protein DCP31_02260 [Cyanobacteria bacterium UBA8543]|nr:hypothetical protein [Cyanobacteria bacterium UBA8543]